MTRKQMAFVAWLRNVLQALLGAAIAAGLWPRMQGLCIAVIALGGILAGLSTVQLLLEVWIDERSKSLEREL